jgi:hypothetical protein
MVVFSLLRRGFAYQGPASPQKLMEDGNTTLAGGLEQMWIPGLQHGEVRYKFFGNMAERV